MPRIQNCLRGREAHLVQWPTGHGPRALTKVDGDPNGWLSDMRGHHGNHSRCAMRGDMWPSTLMESFPWDKMRFSTPSTRMASHGCTLLYENQTSIIRFGIAGGCRRSNFWRCTITRYARRRLSSDCNARSISAGSPQASLPEEGLMCCIRSAMAWLCALKT